MEYWVGARNCDFLLFLQYVFEKLSGWCLEEARESQPCLGCRYYSGRKKNES